MWTYNKTLQYPITIKCTDPRLAKVIISQYGGPDGELAASLRYLSQRFGMPDQNAKAILNDVANIGLIYIKKIRNFEVNMTDLLSSELQPRLLEVLWKVRQMIFIMNIAVSVYIRKMEVLTNYRASLTKDILTHLHPEVIFSYIDDNSTNKDLLYKDRIFLLKMKGYVNNIILDFSK